MFLPEMLAWLSRSGWLLLLHLSARSSFPKPLPPDEEQALLEGMQAGDADAANTLIEHNLRLVAHIARKYAQPGVDQDDLVSLGTLGLIKAVHTFRPEAGRLTAYASRCIENEMLMFFRANRKNRNVMLVGDSVGQDSEGNDIQLDDLLGTEPDLVRRCCACATAWRTANPGPSTGLPRGWAYPEATSPGLKRRGWKSCGRRWRENTDEYMLAFPVVTVYNKGRRQTEGGVSPC